MLTQDSEKKARLDESSVDGASFEENLEEKGTDKKAPVQDVVPV